MPRKVISMIWRGVRCRVVHTLDYRGDGWSRIDVTALDLAGMPLPCGDGRGGSFEAETALMGDPVAYVCTALDRLAAQPGYAVRLATWRQLWLL